MTERFASSPQTLYAQDRGTFMPAGDKITETGSYSTVETISQPKQKTENLTGSGEKKEPLFKPLNRAEEERPTISFGDAKVAIGAISALQDGKEVILAGHDVAKINEINLKFGDREEAQKQRTVENALAYTQEVFRNSNISEPTAGDYGYAEGAPHIEESATPGDLTINLDRQIIKKVQSRDEEDLVPEKVKGLVTVEEDLEPFPKRSGPGASAGGYTGDPLWGSWTKEIPDDVNPVFSNEVSFINQVRAQDISRMDPDTLKMFLDKINKEKAELFARQFNLDVVPAMGHYEKIYAAMQEVNAHYSRAFEDFVMKERETQAEREGLSEEIQESQYIYYGLVRMPKVRNLGKEDKLKHGLGEADKLVKRLIEEKRLDPKQLDEIRTLSVDDLAKFKEGNSSEINGLGANIQKDIYQALKKDQERWAHKKIEDLPWENLDVTRIGNNLAYREFSNAQSDMLPEVEEYFRSVSRGAELKYTFTKNGMESLKANSSVLKETLEILSQKALGWNDVAGEIENFITVKRGGDRDMREGLYIYEENADGSVKTMRPKTSREIERDKLSLGDEAWKVGGFVRYKSIQEVTKMREHLFKFAQKRLRDMRIDPKTKQERFTEEEIKARAKIAAFMGEWLFWRMKGRSAYWGEQGGSNSAAGGGKGENDLFYVVGFQQFCTQEAKGSGESGRKLRELMFGSDTADDYLEKYVPGMAGGVNFNVGYWDFYSQYSGSYPGERPDKLMHGAGFIRGYGSRQGEKVKRIKDLMGKAKSLSGFIGTDKAWEKVRKNMSDEEKDFLEEYNNLPIVTLASRSSKEALAKIATPWESGGINPYNDAPDYWGGDYDGPSKVRGVITQHDTGFLSDPTVGHIYRVAELSEGRKRIWQRSKIVKDMLGTLLEFRASFNSLEHRMNWNSENIDQILTEARNNDLIVERTKVNLEKELYGKVTGKYEKLIPVWGWLMKNPTMHKIAHIYSGTAAEVTVGVTYSAIVEWLRHLLNYLRATTR